MKKTKLTALLVLLTLISACTPKAYEKQFFAMDTVMDITLYGNDDFSDISAEIFKYDKMFDRGNIESDICKINTNTPTTVSVYTLDIISKSIEITEKTSGAFDIRTAPVSDLWGFYEKKYRVPAKDEIENKLNFSPVSIAENSVYLSSGAIDLGGIAKGYLSDILAAKIREKGVTSAIISLGGNVLAIGKKPNGKLWNIGISNPENPSKEICSVKISDKAVVTSGLYQRGFTDNGTYYHHILNPKTGHPASSGIKSVTVISNSGTVADALSTALFVLGTEGVGCINDIDFEAIFVTDDNKIIITPGIEDIIDCPSGYTVIE